MKNKIFSFGLYKDSFKQIKLVGILFTVLLTLGSVGLPIYVAVKTAGEASFSLETLVPEVVRGTESNSFLIFGFILAAPMLVISLFKFLNKRNASDFYHSIPYTRTCIYLSFFASIVTWLAIIIFVPTILAMLTYLILHSFFAMMPSTFIMMALNCFVGSVLVAAVFTIGSSLSGTTITNLIIGLLVLFFPRFLITIFSSGITSANPLLVADKILPLLSNSYNVVVGFCFNLVKATLFGNNFEIESILLSPSSCIYTAVVAVIMIVLGVLAFNKRESETATLSAPNKLMQNVYRIVFTCAYTFGITTILFADIINGNYIDTPTYIVAYIVGILIYCLYEIITTKSLKKVLKAAPGLIVVALLNIAFLGGMKLVHSNSFNFTPNESDIKSVSIFVPTNDSFSYTPDDSVEAFISKKCEEIEIKDEKIKKIVADSLKDCIETYKSNGEEGFIQKYYGYYGYSSTNANISKYNSYTVKIKTSTGTKYRNIFIKQKASEEMTKLLVENADYKKAWTTLPDALESTINIYPNQAQTSGNFSDDEAKKLFSTLKSEFAKADFTKIYNYYNQIEEFDYSKEFSFAYSSKETGKMIAFNGSGELFPETYKLYEEISLKHLIKERKDCLETINKLLQDDNYDLYCRINIENVANGENPGHTETPSDEYEDTVTALSYSYFASSKQEYDPKILEFILNNSYQDKFTDYSKPYANIYITFESKDNKHDDEYCYMEIPLKDIQITDIPSGFTSENAG